MKKKPRNFLQDKHGRVDVQATRQHADILQRMVMVARKEEGEWQERMLQTYTWKWYYWIMVKTQSRFLGWFSMLRFNRNQNTQYLELKRFGKVKTAMFRGPYI